MTRATSSCRAKRRSLFGHEDAERSLLESYKSGRIAHAWLIGGPPGIGKATLAYRLARFVLAHPDPRAPEVQNATSLAVDADHPVARRMAAQAQGDLLVLERSLNEQTGKLYTVIRVDDVRRTVSFFGSTAGEGGWRIAIVDAVDDLQREGANALLKVLEEPPQRSLLLLISHAPGRELPTIRSRCRRLSAAAARNNGCHARNHGRHAGGTRTSRKCVRPRLRPKAASAARSACSMARPSRCASACWTCSRSLPDPDPRALHALGEAIGGTDPRTLEAFMDMVNGWLSTRLDTRLGEGAHHTAQMARVAETWEKVNRAARDVETYNLERKPLVFRVFGALAEAARP